MPSIKLWNRKIADKKNSIIIHPFLRPAIKFNTHRSASIYGISSAAATEYNPVLWFTCNKIEKYYIPARRQDH